MRIAPPAASDGPAGRGCGSRPKLPITPGMNDPPRAGAAEEPNRVVARYLDGRVLKGTTDDFFPHRPTFRLRPEQGKSVEVSLSDLKAVFFVKDLVGDRHREDVRGFLDAPDENQHGYKIAVKFKDSELLLGYSLSYSALRPGFFVWPADVGSNNLRVYVMTHATRDVKTGAGAEALAQRALSRAA